MKLLQSRLVSLPSILLSICSLLILLTLRILNRYESSAYLGEACVHSLFEVQEILDGQGIYF